MKYKILLTFLVAIFLLIGLINHQLFSQSNGNIYKNLVYAKTTDGDLCLDLYLPPTNIKGPYPLIIWLHAGSWLMGSKDETGPALEMLPHGYAVASVDYRFSSVAKFPAQIHDVKAAVRFLRGNAEKYKLDPDHFGVWGASAGGHLAALLGTSGDVLEMEDVEIYKEYSSRVQAVCDWYGPTDFTEVDIFKNPGLPLQYIDYAMISVNLIGGPFSLNIDKVKMANPITHVSKDDPPFLIMHGDKDDVIPISQSEMLYQALKSAGVNVRLVTIPGAGHNFDISNKKFAPHLKQVIGFFDQMLKS